MEARDRVQRLAVAAPRPHEIAGDEPGERLALAGVGRDARSPEASSRASASVSASGGASPGPADAPSTAASGAPSGVAPAPPSRASSSPSTQRMNPGTGESVRKVDSPGSEALSSAATWRIRKWPKEMPASPFWQLEIE